MLRGYVLCRAMEGSKGAAEGQCFWGGVSLEQRPDWLFTAASHSAMRGEEHSRQRAQPGKHLEVGPEPGVLSWCVQGRPTAAAVVSKRRCGGPGRRRAVQDCDRSCPIGTLGFI